MKTRSTRVPIKGEVVNGIKEPPSQARTRAQSIADGYEAADKDGVHAIKVKAAIASLAQEEVQTIPSVKNYLEGYVESRKGQLSKSTIINSYTAIKLFLAHLKDRASLPITTVRRSDVKSFVNEQIKFVRQRTVRKYMTLLSPAFMSAMDEEIIDKNPFFRAKIPESVVHENVFKEAFTKEDIAKMLEGLPEEWASMVKFCLFTGGQRLGDISTLKWSQIDLKENIISIRTGKSNRKHHLMIPIISILGEHIESLHRSSEFVHPEAAAHYLKNGSRYLSYQFRKEMERLGIIDSRPIDSKGRSRTVSAKSFHCLRATATTLLHTSGVDHALAREIVGHDSEKAHQLYIRPDSGQKRTALERLAWEIQAEG